MAPDNIEVDDFGLPIRKYVPPPVEDEPARDDAAATPTKSTTVKASATPTTPVTEAKESTESNDEKAVAASKTKPEESSDDDEFKDAPSTPLPLAAATPQKIESAKPSDEKATDLETVSEANKTKMDDSKNESADATSPSSPAVAKPKESDAAVPVTEQTPTPTAETSKPEKETNTPGHADPKSPVEQTPKDETTAPANKATGQGHGRNLSTASAGVGEFSHQQTTTKVEEEVKEDEGWQEMPAFAPYDIYDDDNKLVAKERTVEEEETDNYGYGGLGGAGKGYTRVIMDDDAESATSMDENTKYLFKGVNGTNVVEEEEEDQRDAVSQMQATKDLLTEGQKIAYVGLTRLEIVQLVKESEALEKTKGAKKEVTMAAEATKMWGQKMMIRLYAHMDISSAEQVMVEQLSDHGVVPSDLTPLLMANARVKNPMAESNEGADSSETDETSASPVTSPNPDGVKSPKSTSRPASRPTSPPAYPNEEEPAAPPPPYEAHPEGEMPDVKTPSQLPTTENLEIDLRWTVLCDLFLILIADSTYDARSRLLLERIGKSLEIDWLEVRKFEKKVTDALEMQQQAEKENWNEEQHMTTRAKASLKKRYMMMGLATVGGGLVIGLSAGLLAPVIGGGLAAGFAAIGVSGTGAFLGGAGGAAIITTAAASSGSIAGIRAANRRTGAVKTFEYRPLHNNKRVHLIVSVSGWMTGKVDDVRLPFSTVDPIMGDLYSVLWEPEMLRSTGDTINILATEALTQGLQQVLASTILAALMSALQVPIILSKLAYLIDNPWAVSLQRASLAGKILADSLIDRNLGTRPITLVGFSIGARVIFACLQELAKRGAYGLVQNVYMFGSPVVVGKDEYLRARTVVPGRFVNGYNKNDWILGYLFRLTSGGIQRVAGLAPIEGLDWLENKDCSEIVKGHMEYRKMMPRLLRECGWAVESDEFTEIEDPDPEKHSERQRELISEIEAARRELEKEGEEKKKKSSRFSIFGRKKQIEKAEWEIYDTSKSPKSPQRYNEEDEERHSGVLFDVEAIRAELAKDGGEGLQVRELQSTMPPMKLDLSPASSSNPRDHLRETRSATDLMRRISEDPSPSPAGSTNRQRGASPYYTEPEPYKEDEISMTFDTSFDDTHGRPSPPPKDEPSVSRPDLKTSQTVPNMTLRDPWNDPDDDDFGKEKEMTMTFA